MPRKRQGISTSDRDILRPRKARPTESEDDAPPLRSDIPPLGETPESIIAFMNAIATACANNLLDEKRGDTLTAMARTALNAVKHRDTKVEDRELDEMLRRAEAVEAAGLQREADDRRHVIRGSVDADAADAGEGADDD